MTSQSSRLTAPTAPNTFEDFRLSRFHAERLLMFMNDSDTVHGHIRSGATQLMDAAVDLEELGESGEISLLQEDLYTLIDLEHKLSSQKEIFSTLKDSIHSGLEKDILEEYQEQWTAAQKKYNSTCARDKYHGHERVLDFQQSVWNVHHPDEVMPITQEGEDDDMIVGSTKLSLRCPLTTTWFEEPVTSHTCKHTFSKKAIVNMIVNSRGQVQCPIPAFMQTQPWRSV
ncbi:zinc-finger of the MIZ type in Nse subunit-domain-containing protein [Spinellus fusiger]|nr:zinc-finger of the MIZ type in Nse subunit-domain-containing protein [Spinellus fusiger]